MFKIGFITLQKYNFFLTSTEKITFSCPFDTIPKEEKNAVLSAFQPFSTA